MVRDGGGGEGRPLLYAKPPPCVKNTDATYLSGNESSATLPLASDISYNRTGISSATKLKLSQECIASGFHINRVPASIPVT